jgi:hypothetical protein
LVSLVVWKMTSNPTLALYLAILTEAIGFIPTIEKPGECLGPGLEFYFQMSWGLFSVLSVSVFAFSYAFQYIYYC